MFELLRVLFDVEFQEGTGCWVTPHEGRPVVSARVETERNKVKHIKGGTMARQICEAEHGPPPSSDHHAAHLCHNDRCLKPSHLEWQLSIDNMVGGKDRTMLNIRPSNGGLWRVQIDHSSGNVNKCFRTVAEAKQWRDEKRAELGMLPARTQ